MNNNENWKLETAKKIVNLIQTGIEDENGYIRKFDILDYYQNINIAPKTLYDNTVDELGFYCSSKEIKDFNSFVIRSLSDKRVTVENIMDVKHMMIIDGEMREITDEEKLNVIQYLVSNKIRLTDDVYAIALKRYLEGTLDLNMKSEDEKNKTLVR